MSRGPGPARQLTSGLLCGLVALGFSALDAGALPDLGPQKTIGQPSCAGCHFEQNDWWFRDAHSLASLALQRDDPRFSRFVVIADRYKGLDAKNMASSDSICMACHGTVITSKPDALDFGISCESCHGPAELWLEQHRQGDKSLGTSRPGYVAALELGMRELKQLDQVAKTCTDCHYITDRELRMAGHPDGLGWDLADQIKKVRHWSAPLAPYETLNAAFSAATAKRGRPPVVARPMAFRSVGKRSVVRPGSARFSRRSRIRAVRPTSSSSGSKRIDLPAFDLAADLSIAEKLVLLSERLESINRELR